MTRNDEMTDRYLWTFERKDQPVRSGLDTDADLIAILQAHGLPGVMPADWILATLHFDPDRGVAVHDSALGWTLTAKRLGSNS